MRSPRKLLKWLAIGAALLVVLVLAVRSWVVPALIVGRIEAMTGGKATIRGWWLNGGSAGVVGLKVFDGRTANAPVWAEADRVRTDLSLARVLRAAFAPRRVWLERPKLVIRLDRKGDSLTRFGAGGRSGRLPIVVANEATVTIRQEGRPEFVVDGVTARLAPDGGQLSLAVRSNQAEWGPFEALGRFDSEFHSGRFEFKTLRGILANPEKARAIPFVPSAVWDNVAPSGMVDVRLSVDLDRAKAAAFTVHTEILMKGTTVASRTLDLSASDSTGRVVVDGSVVRLESVSGRAIDGRVTADGSLDFSRTPPKFDLRLGLTNLNVADTPKSWQLDEAGVTGHLTGKVHLLALLDPKGADLSGSSGDAVVEKGEIQGIPFKSLRLQMSAQGADLRYDAGGGKASNGRPAPWLVAALVALQAPESSKAQGQPRPPVVQLPKSISTHLELEDVDLGQLIRRAEFLVGYPFPLPIAGRLSLKADATIPLGRLKSLKEYAFHGDLTLKRASAYRVDLGTMTARIDLADGLLVLKDLRGRLVDHPDGGPDNPPEEAEAEVAIPVSGPLPPGGFRGDLRAALAPAGALTAAFEGVDLPLGELGAPFLPRPTPLSGLATMRVNASGDLNHATDPASWTVTGTGRSRRIRSLGATLDALALTFGLKAGRLDVPELTARLGDRPLSARVNLDVKPPHAFRGSIDVAGWSLAEVLAWMPQAPKPAPIAGAVSARAEASGTLLPFALQTRGDGRLDAFRAGFVTLGAVPFQWTTRGDSVALRVTDARPFDGGLTASATIPLSAGRPIRGQAEITAIDTAKLSAAIPGGGLALTGRAGGKVSFSIPAKAQAVDATVTLSAPDLTVQGLPAREARATVKAHKGSIGYEVTADSLGGKVSLKGSIPLADAAKAAPVTTGEARVVGFELAPLWQALGMSGALAKLSGRGALDANVRAVLGGRASGMASHGIVVLRDLKWGPTVSLGGLRGELASTPGVWRVDPIQGELLGGSARGFLWVSGAGGPKTNALRQVGFDLRIERTPLSSLAALLPFGVPDVEGAATLELAGTMGETGQATVDLLVSRGKLAGLPIADLKLPAKVTLTAEGNGSGVVHIREGTAQVAGGRVRGGATLRFGQDRAFETDLTMTGVDLETVARIASEAHRPATGKINGRITVHGPDRAQSRGYRGKIVLDLDDASLVALPVFREINRLLGTAGGGLFEDGDLTGTISNRQVVVDRLTLEGRAAQLHASGTVGFDGQVNLEVLVNTNQIIGQTGQALVGAIPGLGGVLGRDRESRLRVANYLSNRLLKLRVSGTLRNPSVAADPAIVVAETAVGFFAGVLKLPLGLVK